jgi:Reverse transcriptase (RNA-dependent DNA polymerase).
MSLLKPFDKSKLAFYLPHHGVLRKESLTTKLRVVFDGSAKSNSGFSINDLQYAGPSIQNDIFSILLRFRQHTLVMSADIEKMYRQILIHPDDRHLQRIVWRNNSNESVSVYELNTVTYGTKSAPYLAIRCLKQVAYEFQDQFPIASEIILRDFYVDDLITGFDSEEEAITICKEIIFILNSVRFPLRKWTSNSSRFLEKN